jgi:hypothetical protein
MPWQPGTRTAKRAKRVEPHGQQAHGANTEVPVIPEQLSRKLSSTLVGAAAPPRLDAPESARSPCGGLGAACGQADNTDRRLARRRRRVFAC